jgi:hypothetical protein
MSIFHFARWNNFYVSNNRIGDEIRYVLDRKELTSQLGNTLERPSLLHKREFVRKTNFDNEVLKVAKMEQRYEMQNQMHY